MREYTDADVARMLGWPIGSTEYYIDNRATNMIAFGLSTPPSPEADANSARYVLPFIVANGWDYYLTRGEAGVDTLPMGIGMNGMFVSTGDHFGPTLCRACLRAVEESK